MRGEYLGGGLHCEQSKELPPRARRILSLAEVMRVFDGTTSACAENTVLIVADQL